MTTTTTEQEAGVPNLDAMEQSDLRTFWHEATTTMPVRKARQIFPDRRKGYVSATRDLGYYAINKSAAMGCRAKGDIQAALMYEGICDQIYKGLPEWARW